MHELILSTGPILRRELLGLLRSRKAFWITVLTVAATGLVPLYFWAGEGDPMPFAAARRAFLAYRVVLYYALVLLVPLVSSGSIREERRRGTYELLYSTTIHPGGIVLGKFLSSALFFVLLLAFTFPAISVLYLLGGFQAGEFGDHLLASAFLILFFSQVGLFAALEEKWYAILPIVLGSNIGFALFIPFFEFFRTTVRWCCIAGLLLLPLPFIRLFSRARYPLYRTDRDRAFKLDLARVVRILTRPDLSGESRKRGDWITRKVLQWARRGIPDGWNPVLVASLRSKVTIYFVTGRHHAILILSVALLSVPIAPEMPMETYNIGAILAVFIIALVLPGVIGRSVAAEWEPGRLDLLRGTLLSPWEIILGKALEGLLLVAVFLAWGLALILLLVPFHVLHHRDPVEVLCCLLLFLGNAISVFPVTLSTAIFGSLLIRSARWAPVASFLMALGHFLVLSLVCREYFLSPLAFLLDWQYQMDKITPIHGLISVILATAIAAVYYDLSVLLFRKRWMRD